MATNEKNNSLERINRYTRALRRPYQITMRNFQVEQSLDTRKKRENHNVLLHVFFNMFLFYYENAKYFIYRSTYLKLVYYLYIYK